MKINHIPKELTAWNKATMDLTILFISRYFPDYEDDAYWIGQEIGGVLSINDFYFDLPRIKEAIEYNATSDQLIDYYYAETKMDDNLNIIPLKVNFRNYLKGMPL